MKEKFWDYVSFVVRGKHRKKTLEILEKPKTPTQIKESTGLHFNTVSRTLVELEEKGLIKCLNPQQKLARFYQINEKGKEVLKHLNENT